MKKKIIILTMILILFIIVLILLNKNNKVSNKLIEACKNNEETQIKISDYIDFEWESIVIYHMPKTKKEISDLAGYEYTDSIDISSGIIFIKDNKKVYEEKFKIINSDEYEFIIYPNKNARVIKINREDAIFKCQKTETNGKTKYSLRPIEN